MVNSLSKSFSSRARPAINKKQKYFSLRDHQLDGNLILVLVCKKGQKED